LVLKTSRMHKATQEVAAQFILQPQYTDNPQNICEGITCLHKSIEVPYGMQLWSAFVMTPSQTDVLKVVSVMWL